jgi:3-oxoacyl-[acyl-carrier-protein] synthase II
MPLIKRNRVAVITAMGVAAPGALDPESFWRKVRLGQSAIARIERQDTSETGCCFGGEVPPFDLSLLPAELKPKRVARHTQLVLWAARQIKTEVDRLPKSPSIRLGVATSCIAMISNSVLTQFQRGASTALRYTVTQSPPHAASCAIAKYFRASGNVLAVSTACAAGMDAIGLAARDIISGSEDYVVAGGADCAISFNTLADFVNGGLASVRNSCPERASRPFDVLADSGVCAEGAGVFLIEEKSTAQARGARILAAIAGYGSSLDPDASVPGSGWSICIPEALDDAGWTPAMIDSISAWGAGHPVLDRVEANVLAKIFAAQSSHVPVYSIKGTIGNPFAAGGPLQVAAAIFSFRDGIVPPTANLDIPIPEATLDYVRAEARVCFPETALLNAHGITGANATLLLKAPGARRVRLRERRFDLEKPNQLRYAST